MKIALLTCASFPELAPADQLLIPELAKHGITASAVIWDDKTVRWSDFDYLIFRNTWDYFEKEAEFNLWLDQMEQSGIRTLNPIDVIQENKHKFYLRKMEKAGITIIPTLFVDKTATLSLADIIPADWEKIVIKPAFSGGSYQTSVFEPADTARINAEYQSIAAEKELLVQKFMPEIQSLGETSFIFFNKKFSHCVNKQPIDGDFRVQVQFGGKYTSTDPAPGLIEKAQKVVDLFDSALLYARVDGIIIDNELHLMEIECIEPDLYFTISEGSLQRFVRSILELIQ